MRKIFLLVFLTGCSSVNEISTSTYKIQTNALQILNTDDIVVAHKHARNILGESEDIAGVLGNIKDSTPWWADLLSYGFIAAAILGICVLLWYTRPCKKQKIQEDFFHRFRIYA